MSVGAEMGMLSSCSNMHEDAQREKDPMGLCFVSTVFLLGMSGISRKSFYTLFLISDILV